ncbi:MAG: DUF1573 domain-containing protein, partial [bacterium]|nr:DUF1573 domain-containing protein [bacterium]
MFIILNILLAIPRITFESDVYDFGSVKSGEVATGFFVVINKGTQDLVIKNLRTDCGCTVAGVEKSVLKPLESSKIKVNYDTTGKIGDALKYIYIDSNDPEKPIYIVKLVGIVKPMDHPDGVIVDSSKLLEGSCKSCHLDRGIGKRGQALYNSICAMCHEHKTRRIG